MKEIWRFRWFLVMWLLTVPWIFLRFSGAHPSQLFAAMFSGIAIMASAFILTWAAEAAECDFSGPIVLTLLALITVLPEYAVDGTLAWQAGKNSVFAPYAAANMTGANRLLVGVGWATIIFVHWFQTRKRSVGIPKTQRIDCGILAVASVYALTIPLKGFLSWFDTVVLFLFFGFYLYKAMQHPAVEMEPVGPARAIAMFPVKATRAGVAGACMAYAAFAIYLSAEPFAYGLIETGKMFGIEEFLLVQWLAPLASESPEFIVAILFALRLHAQKGLGLLVASEVNQLTLLVGSVPFFFMIAHGRVAPFPLGLRQSQEITLTAAQSLLAVALLANLNLSLWEAGLLAGLFFAQLVMPWTHEWFIAVYLGTATIIFCARWRNSLRSWAAIARELML